MVFARTSSPRGTNCAASRSSQLSPSPLLSAMVFAAARPRSWPRRCADVLSRAVSDVAGDLGADDDEVDVAAHAARVERRRQLIEKLSGPAVILGSRHAVLHRARRRLAHSRARRAGRTPPARRSLSRCRCRPSTKKPGMSTDRSGSWLHPAARARATHRRVLDHGGQQSIPPRAGQRRPLGQQLDAARPLEAHQRGPNEPRCRGGRGSISGGCSRLRKRSEALQPRRLPVLCPVRPPLALEDIVYRAQREAVHLDHPAARVLVTFDPVRIRGLDAEVVLRKQLAAAVAVPYRECEHAP